MCAVYFNDAAEPCEFGWRDQKDCEGAKIYMKDKLKLPSGFGDGCYIGLNDCRASYDTFNNR